MIIEPHLAPWVTTAEFHQMCRDFCRETLRHGNYDAVVGIPRSGMVPASMAALELGVPLWTMAKHGASQLSTGLRLQQSAVDKRKAQRLLILDDSSASGAQMRLAREAMSLPHLKHLDVTYASVIVTPRGRRNVDLHHAVIELPHWFEWNFFGNAKMLREFRTCVELGVMRKEENLAWTVPRFTHITTLLSDMPSTDHNVEAIRSWMLQHDITCDNLVLRPEAIQVGSEEHITWKAKQASFYASGLYVAEHAEQAASLTRHKNKLVLCPALGKSILRNPEN